MDINTLLGALCVVDNVARRAAEEAYEEAKAANPEGLAGALLGAVSADPALLQPHLKGLAAVLLRRLISGSKSEWSRISPGAQETIKASLLHCVSNEGDNGTRRKVNDALAELAAELLEEDVEGGWPGLLQALLDLVSHPGASQREMSLDVFARIADTVAPVLATQMGVLAEVFRLRLGDAVEVRLAALRALHAFLGAVEESGMDVFQGLLPAILASISDPTSLAPAAEDSTKEALEYLVEIVEYYPRFFRPAVNEFSSFMVALASATAAPSSLRQLSVEWLVSLAEAKPTLARKVRVTPPGAAAVAFPRAAMQVCFAMLLEIEDEPGWAAEVEDEGDPGEIRNMDVGAQALDRLALALGPNTSVPVAFELVNEMLSGEAAGGWPYAHAALHAMCQLVEAGKDTAFAGGMQAQVVACVRGMLAHAQPRVRYMALQALGQLFLDHGPEVQHAHHAAVVPALVASMDVGTNPSPRVRSHACAAAINFVEQCDPEILAPYLDPVLAASLGVLQVGPRIAQEQAVAIISCASMVMEEQLGEPQYGLLMPLLQAALGQVPAGDEFRMLKGRILECISLLGTAVPKERFTADVMPIMAAMAAASERGLDADDPTKGFILKAWVRIGKVLGPDFVPYLAIVMPPLLLAVEASVEQELTPEQIENEEDEADSDTECVIQNADGKMMQIRTSALEEQATAAHMILLISESMGPHFFPYAERCSRALAPLAVNSVHDDVRSYSMAALPELVASVAQTLALHATGEARWQPLKDLLQFFVGQLLEALENEGELELLMTAMQSLKACIENACRGDWSAEAAPPVGGSGASATATARALLRRAPLVPGTSQALLGEAELGACSTTLLRCLAESVQRRAIARAEATLDEDYDEEQAEADGQKGTAEEELQFNISEVSEERAVAVRAFAPHRFSTFDLRVS